MLAVFVDLDGTLAVSPISSVIKEAYRRISLYSGKSMDEVESYSWKIHVELVKKSNPLAFDWDYIYGRVSELLDARIAFSIEKRFRELCDLSKILDDAYEALTRLTRSANTLTLATNGLLKYQKCVIETLGLDKYFNTVITPDIRGCLKNCEKFYEIIGEYRSRVAVGDNYTFDVYYPKKFGLKTVYVVRPWGDPYAKWLGIEKVFEADVTIRSVGLLPDVLLKL